MLLSNSSTKKGTHALSTSIKAFQDASLHAQISKVNTLIERAIAFVAFRPSTHKIGLHPAVKELFEAYGYVFEIEKDRLQAGVDELIIRLTKGTEILNSSLGDEISIRPALDVKKDLFRRAESLYEKQIAEIDRCIAVCKENGSTDIYLSPMQLDDFLIERYQKQGYDFKEYDHPNRSKKFYVHHSFETA